MTYTHDLDGVLKSSIPWRSASRLEILLHTARPVFMQETHLWNNRCWEIIPAGRGQEPEVARTGHTSECLEGSRTNSILPLWLMVFLGWQLSISHEVALEILGGNPEDLWVTCLFSSSALTPGKGAQLDWGVGDRKLGEKCSFWTENQQIL